jgi:chromosomal replication initiation ATPase DnaA
MESQPTSSGVPAGQSPTSCSKMTGKRPDLTPEQAERIVQDAAERARTLVRPPPPANNLPLERAMTELVNREAPSRPYVSVASLAEVERIDKCRKGSRVPERYIRARLDSRLPDGQLIPAAEAAMYSAACAKLSRAMTRPGIYALCGSLGAGKTHMACGLVNEFCGLGRSARYTKAADYIRDYRSTWKMGAGAEDAYEKDYVRLSLLVLDEWQVRGDTDNENLILLRLIDKRYEADKTTLVIGNHGTQDEFERSIDARVADRICDGGGFILCDWPSLRGRIQREAVQ